MPVFGTGRLLLTCERIAMMLATAITDLAFMHATNRSWPPYTRFHAAWNVCHVLVTHVLALAVLWIGPNARSILRVRFAVGIVLAVMLSFFVSLTATSFLGRQYILICRWTRCHRPCWAWTETCRAFFSRCLLSG